MAMKITDDCILCAACEPECPVNAISEGEDIYVIDAAACVECKEHYETPQCKDVCPAEAVVQA